MPENATPTQNRPQISAENSLGDFLDKHPCGEQIRNTVREQGLAEVQPEPTAPAPARIRKPR